MDKKEIEKKLLEPYENYFDEITSNLYSQMDGFEEKMINNSKK